MSQNNEVSGVMRVKAGSAFLGIKPSTFWRWVQQGKIPPGIRLSARCTVWRREDLERFLEQAAAGAFERGAKQ